MRGLLVLYCVAVAAGCADSGPSTDEQALLDACHERAPGWCRDAGAACLDTWCAPAGAACGATVTSFCAEGMSWCSEQTCRTFCSPVTYPRCPAGLGERHERDAGADICVCVP